jgi:hypothetical protein
MNNINYPSSDIQNDASRAYIDVARSFQLISSNILRHLNTIHTTALNHERGFTREYQLIAQDYIQTSQTILNTLQNIELNLGNIQSNSIRNVRRGPNHANYNTPGNMYFGPTRYYENQRVGPNQFSPFYYTNPINPTTTTTATATETTTTTTIPEPPSATNNNLEQERFNSVVGEPSPVINYQTVRNGRNRTISHILRRPPTPHRGTPSTTPNYGGLLVETFAIPIRNNQNNLNNLQNTSSSINDLFRNGIASFLSSSPRVPTQELIARTTRNVRFGDHFTTENYDRCPIDLSPFQNDDEVTQILGCNHIFRRRNIQMWFMNHSTCPVCRYNINDYNPYSTPENNISNNNQTNENIENNTENSENGESNNNNNNDNDNDNDNSNNNVHTNNIENNSNNQSIEELDNDVAEMVTTTVSNVLRHVLHNAFGDTSNNYTSSQTIDNITDMLNNYVSSSDESDLDSVS